MNPNEQNVMERLEALPEAFRKVAIIGQADQDALRISRKDGETVQEAIDRAYKVANENDRN